MKELNEKLARWAGFTQTVGESLEGIWTFPERSRASNMLPNFTEDLNACFKWLVPKFNWFILSGGAMGDHFTAECRLYEQKEIGHKRVFGEAETPALALCKAIEQLIDKGEA